MKIATANKIIRNNTKNILIRKICRDSIINCCIKDNKLDKELILKEYYRFLNLSKGFEAQIIASESTLNKIVNFDSMEFLKDKHIMYMRVYEILYEVYLRS